MADPPSDVIFPPIVADEEVMPVAKVVVRIGDPRVVNSLSTPYNTSSPLLT